MTMKPPKVVHVTVDVTSIAAEQFKLTSSEITVDNNNHITFDNGENYHGFHIHYTLAGAEGYTFPTEDLSDALFVKQGSKNSCPQRKSSWGQFTPLEVRDGGRTLVVWNKNDTEREFSYTLNITNGSKWLPLDPGGTNNNGGGEGINAVALTVGIAVVAAVAAVAYLAFR